MSKTLRLTPHEHVRVRRADPSALEVEVEWTKGGGAVPPRHFHPAQSERFEVLAGAVGARVDGVEHRLLPGDTLDIPAGAVHQMWCDGDDPARAVWETRPAGRTLEWFEALDSAPDAGLRTMAPLLSEYRDVFRLAAKPRVLGRVMLAVMAALALALPAAAQADSIAFIRDHDVWVSAPDGSRQHQVTRDGEAGWPYRSPSQADDGTIVAAHGTDIVALAQNGTVLGRMDPPDSRDSAGQAIGGHPVDVAVSPDGKTIAYSYYQANCPPGADCMTRYVTLTTAGGKTFLNNPSFVADDRFLAFGGWGSQVNFATPAGTHDQRDYWFDDRDLFGVEESEDLGDGELSRDGSRFAAVRSYGENTHLMIFKVNGFTEAPAYACNTGNEASLDSPTWSPDGRSLAFAHAEGVEVLPLPSVEPDCPGAQSGKVVLPGGSEPDWGPADVSPAPVGDPKAAALKKCRAKRSRRARKRCVRRVKGGTAVARTTAVAGAAAGGVKEARFVAYIAGKQVTEWKVPRYPSGSNCQGQSYTEAGGSEVVRWETKPFRLLAYAFPGRTEPMLRFGTWDRFAQTDSFSRKATGSLKRTGSIEYSLDPGECHDSGDPTSSDTGPYDCRRLPFSGYTSFHWRGERMHVTLSGSPKNADGETMSYDNCPIEGPVEPLEGSWTDIDQEFAPRDLFRRDLGLHVVLGRKQWTEKIHRDHGTATTTTTFTVRLRRAGRGGNG